MYQCDTDSDLLNCLRITYKQKVILIMYPSLKKGVTKNDMISY